MAETTNTTSPSSTTTASAAKPNAAQPTGTEITTEKKYEPGYRRDGTPYKGTQFDTGIRDSVSYEELIDEFGLRRGSRLYNDIAVAAYGGVLQGRPRLSLKSLGDGKAVSGLDDERLAKRIDRRKRVMDLLTAAESERAKEA